MSNNKTGFLLVVRERKYSCTWGWLEWRARLYAVRETQHSCAWRWLEWWARLKAVRETQNLCAWGWLEWWARLYVVRETQHSCAWGWLEWRPCLHAVRETQHSSARGWLDWRDLKVLPAFSLRTNSLVTMEAERASRARTHTAEPRYFKWMDSLMYGVLCALISLTTVLLQHWFA
jgi:hypothetical protein